MEAAIERAKQAAPGLFARALTSFERYGETLKLMRAALGRVGCVPREMDQLGAILAGYWILVRDGLPSDEDATDIAKDIEAFIRGADEMEQDDAP